MTINICDRCGWEFSQGASVRADPSLSTTCPVIYLCLRCLEGLRTWMWSPSEERRKLLERIESEGLLEAFYRLGTKRRAEFFEWCDQGRISVIWNELLNSLRPLPPMTRHGLGTTDSFEQRNS